MKRILSLLLLAASPLVAATITVTGSWTQSLSSADLTAGAGSNLPDTLTSASDLLMVDVTNAPLLGAYHVFARVPATGLPPGVTLAIRRTGDGTSLLPLALIQGGTGYTALTTTDVEIFSGELNRSAIPLQLRATGVSVAATPATYLSSVILTVTP